MKKFLTSLMLVFLFSGVAFAGAGHDHGHGPATKAKPEAVAKMAGKKLQELIEKGKIDKSWKGKKAVKVEQKTFSKGPEWVVIFRNANHKVLAKRTLFMFYTMDGKYIASNFTGN